MSGTERVERAWMKKWEGGRRATKGRRTIKGNLGTVLLGMRDRDEEMSRQRKRKSVILNSELRHWRRSVFYERRICLWNSDKEIAILWGNSSIFDQQSTTTVHGGTGIREKQTESRDARRRITIGTGSCRREDVHAIRRRDGVRLGIQSCL